MTIQSESIQSTIVLTASLIGIVLFIASCEFLFLSRQKKFSLAWSYENLEIELHSQLPLPRFLTRFLFSDLSFVLINKMMLILIIILFFQPILWVTVALFIGHLLNCIRFRGTFNGGSDMMIVVVLSGLTISMAHPDWEKAGLIYIAIHTLFSYFKAGLVKLKSSEWKNGSALPTLLNRSQIGLTKNFASFLKDLHYLVLFLSWSVILFELSIIILLFEPQLKIFYFTGAILFHFSVYLGYGLNRFFWAWLAAWPAVFFFLSILQLA